MAICGPCGNWPTSASPHPTRLPRTNCGKEKTYKPRTVTGTEFVRGFLQHTLPPGFQKIRHYGWMSSNSKVSLEEVKWLVWMFWGWTFWLASGHVPRKPPRQASVLRCAMCGGRMKVVHVTFESTEVLSEHALAYLDSGWSSTQPTLFRKSKHHRLGGR